MLRERSIFQERGQERVEAKPQASAEPTPAPQTAFSDQALARDVERAVKDLYEDLNRKGGLEQDDRQADTYSGAVLTDRFGYTVLTSHRIERPAPETVQQSHLSIHLGGPNKGESRLDETVTFNTALPEDWHAVLKTPLSDASNLGASNYPVYWRKYQEALYSNGKDTVDIKTRFEMPGFTAWDQNLDLGDPGSLVQGYIQEYRVSGEVVGREMFSSYSMFNYAATRCAVDDNAAWDDKYYFGEMPAGISDRYRTSTVSNPFGAGAAGDDIACNFSGSTGDGGYTYTFYNNTSGIEMFSMTFRLLTDKGLTVDPMLAEGGSWGMWKHESAYPFNVGVSLTAPGWEGREIDLLFENDIWSGRVFETPEPQDTAYQSPNK